MGVRSFRRGNAVAPIGTAGKYGRGEWLEGVASAADDACAAALTSTEPIKAVADVIGQTARAFGVSPWKIAADVLDRALGDSRLAQISPTLALQADLSLLIGAACARDAFVWFASRPGQLACVCASATDDALLGRVEMLAKSALERNETVITHGTVITGVRSCSIAVPVCRCDVPQGVLVLRVADTRYRDIAAKMALRAAPRLSIIFERWQLLERNQAREHSLLQAAEKRFVRLGYDLHDGPLQQVVSLAEELRLLRSDVEPLVTELSRDGVAEGFASAAEQVAYLEQALRAIAQSLETSALRREPLEVLFRRELAVLERRAGITTRCEVAADLPVLTDSQRIALYRVVQEALTNVREHSGATRVSVRLQSYPSDVMLTICDDGRGFDVDSELPAAAGRGRLGLVGIVERIRLLGGTVRISSAPGKGTKLTVALAHWTPMPSPGK
jgi:signal transduction histidine kinase